MGADFIDYVLVDPFVVPVDQQTFFTEKLVHLPDCYQVNDSTREIAEQTPTRLECGLPEDSFVFCCFNNNYKITPTVFDVWMRLLKAVPGSVLWLLRDTEVAERKMGPILEKIKPWADHMAQQRHSADGKAAADA